MIIGASSAENAANRLVLLPFVVDGEGVQSRLIITNVSDSANHCSLDFSGPDLGAGRFEDHFLVTAEGATANFELAENGGSLIWTSKGGQSLTYGYASLACAEPVTARVLYSASAAGEFVSLTSMPGSRQADRFQFTLIPQVGSLALVLANDQDPDASCQVELESPYGSVLRQASISVPAMTSVFQMTDELFRIPEDYTAGAVRVSCDREVAATGFLLKGGMFSVLSPAVLAKPMIGISGGVAATEGGDVVFTITANASSAMDMAVSLTVRETGNFVDAGDLGEKQVILPAGSTSVDYIVATIDDSEDKVDGSVTVTINPADGYMMSEIDDSAQAVIRDNDKPVPVAEPSATEPPVSEPPVSQPPVTPPDTVEPASPALTGVNYFVSRAKGRGTLVTWETQPEDASIRGLGLSFEPALAADVFSYSDDYLLIRCEDGYRGNVAINLSARSGNVELRDTVNFFCE